MATNYEKNSTKEGLKNLISYTLMFSDGCDICSKFGIVEFPCKYCLVTEPGDVLEKRLDEWLQEESD